MKKFILVLFVLLIFGCGEKKYKPGKYIGVGMGNVGEIKLELSISKNHRIENIVILEYSDTPGISDEVFSKLPQAIIKANSTDVDVISGASKTSQGVIDAVKQTLNKALDY